ncbi:bestrophin family protein [Chryseobacterium salviniae]|uniref:Bestrophin family ion channel n=1 Tax=Chryseobacterium salviniae TaxID=3101750 RepID=A0ABU6HM91_9FLAO|nr:bestrophin family ion channel [Chryseobacterium sp. T9W2-O]MEC3874170.1 bestrophin family ion channel [Chryseobacterium sp. T9W2-O]
MITKRNFDLRKVFWNIRFETLTTLLVAITVFVLHHFKIIDLTLPFSIAGILGSALAIFIAFRNQSSYARWWEARTIWGGIINNSRIFARQLIANVDNAVTIGKVSQQDAGFYKKEMIDRQIAFAHSLRLHLRKQESLQEFQHLLSESEFNELRQKQNRPNILLNTQGIRIKEAMQKEMLGAFDNISMEPNLATFSNWQGACERIKNTPLPMNYQYFTKLFLYVFIFVLPICLIGDFTKMNIGFMVIPVSFIISFVFSVMNRVGEINENPFENQMSDIPMTALCNTIERDLKEMLGEPMPEKMEAKNGYLF